MPPHATKGDDVSMECIYDLESDKLYSVKWYRNGHEFYRYIPSDKQKRRIYDRPGINVDVSAKVFKKADLVMVQDEQNIFASSDKLNE